MSKDAEALLKEFRALRVEIGGMKSVVNQMVDGLAGLRSELMERREGRARSEFAETYGFTVEISRASIPLGSQPGFKARTTKWSAWEDGMREPVAFKASEHPEVIQEACGIGVTPYDALHDLAAAIERRQMLHVAGHAVMPPRPSNMRPEGQ